MCLPINWKPTGIPFGPLYIGKLTTGNPINVQGALKIEDPVEIFKQTLTSELTKSQSDQEEYVPGMSLRKEFEKGNIMSSSSGSEGSSAKKEVYKEDIAKPITNTNSPVHMDILSSNG